MVVISLTSDIIATHAEAVILSQLAEGDSYGYEINKRISAATGGLFTLSEGTMYTVFRRMEQAGMVTAYWGGNETGARRRYYRLTPYGREMAGRLTEEWEQAKSVLNRLFKFREENRNG